MNIAEYEKKYLHFAELHKDKELSFFEKQLSRVLKVINALEDFYMSTGTNYYNVSENFRNEAHKERQELCRESSALHELIRNFKEAQK